MNKADSPIIRILMNVTGIILLLFIITAIWSIPREVSDLYISLAAGRDVIAGKLNTPDDWSFSTNNRVWINQNWGAGLIFYLANVVFGDTGLLAVKFVLLALCALFLSLALHTLKIPLPLILLVTSFTMAAINVYAILRPNLFTIALVPLELWFLYKSREQTWFIWPAAAVTLIWANVHGGFVFGLGMLWLRAACVLIPAAVGEKGKAFRAYWQLPAAAVTAVALAGIVTPFGIRNLTLPFMFTGGAVWNTLRDWLPIWETGDLSAFMSGIICFLVMLAVTLILLGLHLVYAFVFSKQKVLRREKRDTGGILFDAILALTAVIMAVLSNRFLALALILTAPILARELHWHIHRLRHSRPNGLSTTNFNDRHLDRTTRGAGQHAVQSSTKLSAWLPAAIGYCLVFALGAFIIFDNVRSYDARNPVRNTGTGSFFERMHYTNTAYNPELLRFIIANNVSGNVFNPWKWEGYLRWNAPRLKSFIGGRGHQIYTEDAFNQYMYITGSTVPAYQSRAPQDILNATGAHYLITGNSHDFDDTIITALSGGNWVIIYADARSLLFADTSRPEAAEAAKRLSDGGLRFETDAARAMSMAANVLSRPGSWQAEHIAVLFSEAYTYEPGWLWSYKMLFTNTRSNPTLFEQVVGIMERQLFRLESMSLEGADAVTLLQCRMYIAGSLADLAGRVNRPDIAEEMNTSYLQSKHILSAIYSKWKPLIVN
ncbi:MAG: hypothetical protein JW881_20500 [Spirochaetales bacterium]|nr:hypothetical protein [Spirochaetales bacterium]